MRLFVGKLLASLLVLATVVLGGFAGVMILQWLGLATFDGARRGFPEIAAFAIGASVASAIAVLLFLPRQPNLWVSQSGSGSSPRPWYRAISACS